LCDGTNKRVFLGSFAKPRITSKKRLRQVVQEGLSREEIETKYRIGPSVKGSLGAFIAHRTMNTYKPVEPEQKEASTEIAKPKINTQGRLPRLIPGKYQRQLLGAGKISKNIQLRMNYFLKDTRHLSENRKQNLYSSISESNWFRDLNKNPSDLEVYTFFDDIMLNMVHQNKHIKTTKIRSLWDKIMASERLYEVSPIIKTKPVKEKKKKPKKSKLTEGENQEIYEYLQKGFPDEEIMKACNLSRQQLGARKAWITMRNS
jgi:hypothetical protein